MKRNSLHPWDWLASVSMRLMLWNTVTLATILGVTGILVRISLERNLLASVDRQLAQQSQPPWELMELDSEDLRNIDESRLPFPFMDRLQSKPPSLSSRKRFQREALTQCLPSVFTEDDISHFPMPGLSPWDSAMLTKARRLQNQQSDFYSTINYEGQSVRVLTRVIRRSGKVYGIVQTPYSLTEVKRTIHQMRSMIIPLIAPTLFVASLGGVLLTHRALRPAAEISVALRTMNGEDLSRRLRVLGNDEFSDLARIINGLLNRIAFVFQQREQLVVALQQKVEQEQRFTADASHELKTPLTIIKGNTSLLLRSLQRENSSLTTETIQEMVEEIDHSADSMSRLVHDLLLLARADAEQLGHDTILLPLQEVLLHACNRLPIATCQRICITNTSTESPFILGNPAEMERLFSNLMENAARHSAPETKVDITITQTDETIAVAIQDKGDGIAPEHLPRLGERFYRVDPSRSRMDGGSGLGLAISKSIVKAHKGNLRFESIVGTGTTVTVTLPIENSKVF